MPNHVHLVGVPEREASLGLAVGRAHMTYARHANRRQQWWGHLWANRFYSSPLDDEHCWAAIRYVERNPVRAGLVERVFHGDRLCISLRKYITCVRQAKLAILAGASPACIQGQVMRFALPTGLITQGIDYLPVFQCEYTLRVAIPITVRKSKAVLRTALQIGGAFAHNFSKSRSALFGVRRGAPLLFYGTACL
jgi:hypothetical protein